MNKSEGNKFVREVHKGLLSLGCKELRDNREFYEYEVETIVGKLSLTLYKNQSVVYTLFGRFENVGKAKKKFDCNQHSGKYNIMLSGIDVNQAIEVVINDVEMTLDNEVE